MKKRIFSILLCLCMALTLFHATAFAEGPSSIDITYEFDYGTLPEGRQNPETIVREPSGTIIELPDLEDCGERRLLGWQIKNSDDIDIYPAGTEYAPSKNMTFVAVYEEYVTLTVPFTTTVVLDDVGVPGATTFDLAIVDANAGEESYADVTVSGSVTTDGAGDYKATLTLTGPFDQLVNMLCEGAFVQQVNAGEEGWTYDDTVYGLLLREVPYSLEDAAGFTVIVVPAFCNGPGNYFIDWNNLQSEENMCFTNTYAAHKYTLQHNETSHWNKCACGDSQDPEFHKYGDWKVTKEATKTEEGQREHTCTICDYTETESIAKLTGGDTPKPDTDVPQTGDNSNPALWFALLTVSAAGVIGTGMYSKCRRNSRAK